MGQTMVSFHLWLILVAGCLGLVMGINRTIKTREHESAALGTLSAIAGILLIGASIYTIVIPGGLIARTSHAIPFMMILGLSLSARQLESVPVTAVFILILGLCVLYLIGHGGIPHSITELLKKHNLRELIMVGALVIVVSFLLALSSLEKLVDMILNTLGLGIVVIVLSAISMVHAGLVLYTGNHRGLLQFIQK